MAKNLVLGAGRLYFEPEASSGAVDLGNTPSFSFQRQTEYEEVRGSAHGYTFVRDRPVVFDGARGNFTTDEISLENIGLFLSQGEVSKEQTTGVQREETFTVRRNRSYQLGKTINGIGVRHARVGRIDKAGERINVAANLLLDVEKGRFAVRDDAPDIEDGATLVVGFFASPVSGNATLKAAYRTLYGSLHFVATNRVGPQTDAFFPRVSLSPDSAIDFLERGWLTLSFEFHSALRSVATPPFFLTQAGQVTGMSDEDAIRNEGLTLQEFALAEDELDRIINIALPESIRS